MDGARDEEESDGMGGQGRNGGWGGAVADLLDAGGGCVAGDQALQVGQALRDAVVVYVLQVDPPDGILTALSAVALSCGVMDSGFTAGLRTW